MHGDRILVRIGRTGADGRAEGEIVRVLTRAHPTCVGEFRVRANGNFVVPHDERIQQWIEDSSRAGDASARLGWRPDWRAPARDQKPRRFGRHDRQRRVARVPRGAQQRRRARDRDPRFPEDFGVDVEIVIRKHHLPTIFPPR